MKKVRIICALSLAIMAGCQGLFVGLQTEQRILDDKTLVAWISPANLEQKGSGVVSLMSGEAFDAIVLGEKQRGKWMAGSDYFRRTQNDQTSYAAETVKAGKTVQIAIVYAGTQVTIYRSGKVYASYDAGGKQIFAAETDILIGLRYRGTSHGEQGFFKGDIEEVRVYDVVLDKAAIQAMKLNEVTEPKPVGMWTFENNKVSDTMGNFPKGRLFNGAVINGGKLRLNGKGQYMLVSSTEPAHKEKIQAGFYTPREKGKMWDTWAYYHKGRYYLYYLAGAPWSKHDLAISKDGVHWKEYGTMLTGREGTKWTGTGHIWKAPDFKKSGKWVMNYSEWFGDKQDIMFVTSTDLVDWTKVDEKLRFVQDTRWYKEKGRWDCIDTVRRADGSLYGYFTADPVREKVDYTPCGFGFAQSKDGISWQALPPVEGDISGEFGGINKIGDKYYILISEGRVAIGDRPEGPFRSQKKNPNAFGKKCDIYFPRFFHNAPGGPLVNHFYKNGAVYAAPFKDVEVDEEGVLRLKWWKGNNKLKSKSVRSTIAFRAGYADSILMADKKLDLTKAVVIEGTVDLPKETGTEFPGVFFDHGNGVGHCVLFTPKSTRFGTIKSDGGDFAISQTVSRDLNFGNTLKFRVVMKHDMMEVYMNDYLMTLKRVRCNGRIGFICGGDRKIFRQINIWQSK